MTTIRFKCSDLCLLLQWHQRALLLLPQANEKNTEVDLLCQQCIPAKES